MSEKSTYEENSMSENQSWYKSVLDTINEGVILQAESGEILAIIKGLKKSLGLRRQKQ